jgi:hypothetical protein
MPWFVKWWTKIPGGWYYYYVTPLWSNGKVGEWWVLYWWGFGRKWDLIKVRHK